MSVPVTRTKGTTSFKRFYGQPLPSIDACASSPSIIETLLNLHPEVVAAFSMIVPSIVATLWMLNIFSLNIRPNNTLLAGFGCVLHFPWSAVLHLYRAYGKSPERRTLLYKFDVSFIHIHCMCQNYAWDMQPRISNVMYHVFSICHTWYVNPLTDPPCKRYMDVLAAFGVVCASFPMVHRSLSLYIIAIALWSLAFVIYARKAIGDYSPALFHVILAGPQFIMLYALNMIDR